MAGPGRILRPTGRPKATGTASGGGGCCCDELDCLKITGYTGEITPLYYSFTLSGFVCDCAGDGESAEVRLYQVDSEDDTVWRSEAIRCTAPADAEVEPVVVTSVWTWSTSTSAWTLTSTDVEVPECEPVEPAFDGTTNGQTARPATWIISGNSRVRKNSTSTAAIRQRWSGAMKSTKNDADPDLHPDAAVRAEPSVLSPLHEFVYRANVRADALRG